VGRKSKLVHLGKGKKRQGKEGWGIFRALTLDLIRRVPSLAPVQRGQSALRALPRSSLKTMTWYVDNAGKDRADRQRGKGTFCEESKEQAPFLRMVVGTVARGIQLFNA